MEKTTRMTIDIPSTLHRQIKSLVGLQGITLKEFILSQIETSMEKYREDSDCPLGLSHIPNKETREALIENENERNRGETVLFHTTKDLFNHIDTLEKEANEEN
jgi:hypothetical protein